MAERIFLIDGKTIYDNFLSDLSQLMDHSYDFDEVISLYGDWCRRGEVFVNDLAGGLFPPDVAESADDFIALRNAMINMYCAVDRATPGLTRHRVMHMAFCESNETLLITTR